MREIFDAWRSRSPHYDESHEWDRAPVRRFIEVAVGAAHRRVGARGRGAPGISQVRRQGRPARSRAAARV